MRKWITAIIFALCFCLCVIPLVHTEEITADTVEETAEETPTPEIEDLVIDFDFCVRSVTDEDYILIETNYPKSELSYLQFLYIDFNGEEQKGEMIVNRHIEFDVLDALQDLYEADLPIDELSLFIGDGFDVAFMAPAKPIIDDDDPYNQIFANYDFAWNENQTNGARHYTVSHKIAEWYP